MSNPSLCLWPTTVNHIFICGNPIQAESLWVAKRGLSGLLDSRTPSMNLNKPRSVQWESKEKWAKSWGWVWMFWSMRHFGHFKVKYVDSRLENVLFCAARRSLTIMRNYATVFRFLGGSSTRCALFSSCGALFPQLEPSISVSCQICFITSLKTVQDPSASCTKVSFWLSIRKLTWQYVRRSIWIHAPSFPAEEPFDSAAVTAGSLHKFPECHLRTFRMYFCWKVN